LDSHGKRFFLDPVLVAEEFLMVAWERQDNAVGQLQAVLAAQAVDLVNQVANAAFERELGVERQVERDRQAVLAGYCPAFLAAALDEDFVRAELVAVHAEAAAVELFDLAGLERPADGAELLAELRPEHRQVRLHAQLARVDLPELDLLDAQLLGDLVHMGGHAVGALHDEATQRLPELDPRLRARLPAELDDPPHRANFVEQRLVGLGDV